MTADGRSGERLEIDVADDEVDWVSGLLWSVGVDAVEERDGLVAGRTTLVTAPDSPALRTALGDHWPVQVLPADDSVLDAWRSWAVPVRCGRLVVLPTWVTEDVTPDGGPAPADADADADETGDGGVGDGRDVGGDDRSGRGEGRSGPVDGGFGAAHVRVGPGVVREVGAGRAVPSQGPDGVRNGDVDDGADAAQGPLAPRHGDVVVRIDPGRAFGHGAHPTTRAVLDQVVARVTAGSSVLDVGCGSGVLAVAAAALGANRVVAIDLDDDAVRATLTNAEANEVADRITVSTTPLDQVTGSYDLVVANIGAATLVELAPHLAARGAATGALVLSGLLQDRRDEVVAAFSPGLSVEVEVVDDGWCTVVLVNR